MSSSQQQLSQKTVKLVSGNSIPAIGLGVYLMPSEETASAVETALEIGYRHIDSAACYDNEAECAEGILNFLKKHPEVKREEVFFTTKLWIPDYGYEEAKKGIQKSFQKVKGLGYIDLFLIHSPHGGKEKRLGTWKAMQEAVQEGILKNIGVSCYGPKHIEELVQWPGLTVKPTVNQIEVNPWLQQLDIVESCQKHGIVVEAFSPLMAGMRLNDPQLLKLGEKYHKTTSQILIRWSIQKGYVPLPKSVRPDRIRQNFEVFDFDISEEDMVELGDPKDRYLTVPQWDPYYLD